MWWIWVNVNQNIHKAMTIPPHNLTLNIRWWMNKKKGKGSYMVSPSITEEDQNYYSLHGFHYLYSVTLGQSFSVR